MWMKEDIQRLDRALRETVDRLIAKGCPPQLAAAVRHAVLSRGNRLRPRLLYAVLRSAAGGRLELADRVAVAIELLHCASLVHDDLPCFDNATVRRGVPTVHTTYGEPIAVLTGDALIVASFEGLADVVERAPQAGAQILRQLAAAAGAPHGLVCGQAWESEPSVDLERYHKAKTASLFQAAAASGAILSGADPLAWASVGSNIGAAYQLIDDIRDQTDNVSRAGKPTQRDAVLGRPNAVLTMGLEQAVERVSRAFDMAAASVPACPHPEHVRGFIASMVALFRPASGRAHESESEEVVDANVRT